MKKNAKFKTLVAVLLAASTLLPGTYAAQDAKSPVTALLAPRPATVSAAAPAMYYNLAFKATVPVTSHMNPANIEDKRLVYQNWASSYGIASSAWNVVSPQPYSSHKGQDWDSWVTGEALYAINSGVVTRAHWDSMYGNRVDMTYGDWTISYSHMSRIDVWVGQSISAGQKVGNVGSTGNVTGEHVHIALEYQGKLVDPHPFVTGIWTFDGKSAELAPAASLPVGTYTNNSSLGVRVRSGAGTGYSQTGTIWPGQQVNITRTVVVGNSVWGQHSLGWSCLKEGTAAYMTASFQTGTYINNTALGVRTRSGAGTAYGQTGTIWPGQSVSITQITTIGGDVWGRHAGGWSCLSQNGSTFLTRR